MCAPVATLAKNLSFGAAMQKIGMNPLGSVSDIYRNSGVATKKDPFGGVEIDYSKGRF